MNSDIHHLPEIWDPEPRWPALIAVLGAGGLYAALPSYLIFGPHWLFPALVIVLLVPTVISHSSGHHDVNRWFGIALSLVITIGMIVSVVLLILALPTHRETPTHLLFSAASLWVTNILVFALWYWRLDAGGPHGRDKRVAHTEGAFLFPQMTLPHQLKSKRSGRLWSPNFVDYLFLAFNTSTAFSPTDVPVLARWAKLVTMLQSLISLTVLVLLAARAVNIL
jgi:hypothetical protein